MCALFMSANHRKMSLMMALKHWPQKQAARLCATKTSLAFTGIDDEQKRMEINQQKFLDGASWKRAIFQTRGLRHKVGGSSGSTKEGEHEGKEHHHHNKEEQSSTSSSDSQADPEEMTSKQFRAKFEEKFVEFMFNVRQEAVKNPEKLANFKPKITEFVHKFNEEHAKYGFKMERVNPNMDSVPNAHQLHYSVVIFRPKLNQMDRLLLLALLSTMGAMLYLMYMYRPRSTVLDEHKSILAQPPVKFNEFVKNYLGAGEVQMIFYYPVHNKAVAMLNPGAIIEGQPFTGQGVPIALEDAFKLDPLLFPLQVRKAESELGIDQRESIPIAIRSAPTMSIIFYVFGCAGLLFFVFNTWRSFAKGTLFRVVPIPKRSSGRPVKKLKEAEKSGEDATKE